jgi:hypothetical protein
VVRYNHPTPGAAYVAENDGDIREQFRIANERWNHVGIQLDPQPTQNRNVPLAALVGGDRYATTRPDGTFVHPDGAEEQALLRDLIPITPDNTLTVVFIDMTGSNAYAAILATAPIAMPDGSVINMGNRFFIFIGTRLDLTDFTLAHELHHVLFNRLDTATDRRFFSLNTIPPGNWVQPPNVPVGTVIPLPDVRIYHRIQNLNNPDPNNDPGNDNILNWARRARGGRFPPGGGLGAATATTGNTLTQNF